MCIWVARKSEAKVDLQPVQSKTSLFKKVTTGRVHLGMSPAKAVAGKVLGKLPVTFWAFNTLVDHRNEITGYNLSKLEDDRLYRWTNVHYVKQVVGRAGTEGALTILNRGKKCRLMPNDDVMIFFDEEEGASEISQRPHQVLLGVLRCFW